MTPITGKADTFADYSDLCAYIKARDEEGKTPEQALNVGDNGVGKWGDITAQEHTPMCALSPEYWKPLGAKAHKAKVKVTSNNDTSQVICLLCDTRPPLADVNPGTVIELNPAACLSLGLTPPGTFDSITWSFLDD